MNQSLRQTPYSHLKWKRLRENFQHGRIDVSEFLISVVGGSTRWQTASLLELLRPLGFLTNVPDCKPDGGPTRVYRGTSGIHPNSHAWADTAQAAYSYATARDTEFRLTNPRKHWALPDTRHISTALAPSSAIYAVVEWDDLAGHYREYVVDPDQLLDVQTFHIAELDEALLSDVADIFGLRRKESS